MTLEELRRAAYAADDRLHIALVKQFGSNAAQDARYTQRARFNEETRAAYDAKREADEAVRARRDAEFRASHGTAERSRLTVGRIPPKHPRT